MFAAKSKFLIIFHIWRFFWHYFGDLWRQHFSCTHADESTSERGVREVDQWRWLIPEMDLTQ
jgi:hypothetical protein